MLFRSLVYKILGNHLIEGTLSPGNEITIKVDQTLTQDSTGTMVYLQLEAMDVDTIKTELSVAYIDHNTLQTGFENADDHAFIKSVAQRHGVLFSKPGNGICHQLHLENYGKPGKTLLGSDSHTPTGGGLGMIAIGSSGLDIAVAMAKGTYSLTVPEVVKIDLKGALKPWISAKDRYLADADRPCVVAIDEFQQIAKYPEKNIEALLRTHIQMIEIGRASCRERV